MRDGRRRPLADAGRSRGAGGRKTIEIAVGIDFRGVLSRSRAESAQDPGGRNRALRPPSHATPDKLSTLRRPQLNMTLPLCENGRRPTAYSRGARRADWFDAALQVGATRHRHTHAPHWPACFLCRHSPCGALTTDASRCPGPRAGARELPAFGVRAPVLRAAFARSPAGRWLCSSNELCMASVGRSPKPDSFLAPGPNGRPPLPLALTRALRAQTLRRHAGRAGSGARSVGCVAR
jgi:hypothetical protein